MLFTSSARRALRSALHLPSTTSLRGTRPGGRLTRPGATAKQKRRKYPWGMAIRAHYRTTTSRRPSGGPIFLCVKKDWGERRAKGPAARRRKLRILRFGLWGQKLSRSATPPLPSEPASLGFAGVPNSCFRPLRAYCAAKQVPLGGAPEGLQSRPVGSTLGVRCDGNVLARQTNKGALQNRTAMHPYFVALTRQLATATSACRITTPSRINPARTTRITVFSGFSGSSICSMASWRLGSKG